MDIANSTEPRRFDPKEGQSTTLDEALDQLGSAANIIRWQGALQSAIRLVAKHSGPMMEGPRLHLIEDLAQLGHHLALNQGQDIEIAAYGQGGPYWSHDVIATGGDA